MPLTTAIGISNSTAIYRFYYCFYPCCVEQRLRHNSPCCHAETCRCSVHRSTSLHSNSSYPRSWSSRVHLLRMQAHTAARWRECTAPSQAYQDPRKTACHPGLRRHTFHLHSAGEGVENGGGMGDEGVLRLLGISMGEGRG